MAKTTHGLKIKKYRSSDGKVVHAPEGADPEPLFRKSSQKWLWSNKIGDEIIDLYMGGKAITEISRMPGMPSATAIYHWIQRRPDFKAKMKAARESRGIYFEEKAIEAAEDAQGESSEEVAAQRLKADTYKWAAEVNNPEVYGKRTKVVGDPNAPIAFTVVTGVPESQEKEVQLDERGLIKEDRS